MKNLIFTIAVLAITATLLTSCKRKFTCTCQSAWTTKWYDTEVKALTKRKAKKECTDMIAPEVDGPTSCKLK